MKEIEELKSDSTRKDIIEFNTYAKELAIRSISEAEKAYNILFSYSCLSNNFTFKEKEVDSLIANYKDFEKMFQKHFYFKVSNTVEEIELIKKKEAREKKNKIANSISTEHYFNIKLGGNIPERVQSIARECLGHALSDLTQRLKDQAHI